jgi:hypothetical protein
MRNSLVFVSKDHFNQIQNFLIRKNESFYLVFGERSTKFACGLLIVVCIGCTPYDLSNSWNSVPRNSFLFSVMQFNGQG